jgi:hypothetical protein
MHCARHIGRVAGAVLLACGVGAFLASAAIGQSDDQPVTDPSGLPFSLPEGTDSPIYQEPLYGTTRHSGPQIHSFYGQGFASDEVVAQYVGDIRIAMVNCETPEYGPDRRIVRVDLGAKNYAWAKVVDGLLLRVAEFAWHNCPRTYHRWTINGVDYHYDVHEVDIYTPDGLPVIQAALGGYTGDGSMQSAQDYTWAVTDLGAQRKQQAAQVAQQQAVAAQRAALVQQDEAALATAGTVFRVFLLVLAAGFLFWMREPIARWYYFAFHPHPAAPAIRSALASGTVLDGGQLATILGEAAADGRILRAVRAEQAQALIVEMQSMTQAKIRELEARAKEQYEHAAAQHLQTALAQAAVALEQAKAMLNAKEGATR